MSIEPSRLTHPPIPPWDPVAQASAAEVHVDKKGTTENVNRGSSQEKTRPVFAHDLQLLTQDSIVRVFGCHYDVIRLLCGHSFHELGRIGNPGVMYLD